MQKHLIGLLGVLAGIVFVILLGFVVNAMLESIPHSQPKPQPTEVTVGVIPATGPAPAKDH
jgi:hypothetical protein